MDEASKRHFDAVSTLWKGRWENFNQRRIYEWRFSIIIWTAFAVFISKHVFTQRTPDNLNVFDEVKNLVTGICWIGGIVSLAHIMWLYGIGLKNNDDKEVLWAYEGRMRDILSEIRPLPDKTKNPGRTGPPLVNIHHGPQVVITLVLYAGAILTARRDMEFAIVCSVAVGLTAHMFAHALSIYWPDLLT